MTIMQLIKSRRTIFDFVDQHVSTDMIEQAIEAATWAPNHKKIEPWHFYHIGQKTRIQLRACLCIAVKNKVARVFPQDTVDEQHPMVLKKCEKFDAIPTILIATYALDDNKVLEEENYAALACGIQNMSLYLWQEGIGLQWGSGDIIRQPETYAALGIDAQKERIGALLKVGYPKSIGQATRKPVREKLTMLS